MPIDSLADVRVFRQVVASGGISAAARVLHDSKNRVSQRLVALERSLGVRLAHRTTRSVRLTEEGERFYAHSAALVEAADRVELAIGATEGIDGRVRLAIRSALAGLGLGAELARLAKVAPNLRLQVAVVDENTDLLGGGFDLAVQVGALRDSSLVATRLASPTYALAAAPEYLERRGRPRSPADLAGHQCLRKLGDAPETRWPLVSRQGRRVSARIGGTFESSDAHVQLEALLAGLGIGLLPVVDIRRLEALGTAERVLPSWGFAPLAVWLVSPEGRLRVPRVAAVADAVRRVVARLA
ncbi:MAG: LysR family transcriptional regulator [Myxococcales bacterium]|nr:LysR family transcriptional regulator [Myxococcales bacterium]